MTNEQLAARIRAGEDVGENMAQLYDQVKDFIRSVAWKYKGLGELEDLDGRHIQKGDLPVAVDGHQPPHRRCPAWSEGSGPSPAPRC